MTDELTPRVSVIIPAYNVAPYLGEALASLAAQTMPDFEAIIIDDGSPDDIAAAAAPWLKDPRFRLIRTGNHGLAAARNRGVAEARADLISLLDGDDRYKPDYLAAMCERISAPDAPAFVTCDAVSFGNPSLDGEIFSSRYPQDEPITLERFLSRDVNIFGLSMIVKSTLLMVGGYDETLHSAEDLDFWLRLLATGAVGGLVRRTLVDYRRRHGSLSHNTVPLMRDTVTAFSKLIAALPDGPERALAQARRDSAQCFGDFEAGVDMALAGDVRSGLAKMRSSGLKSDKIQWRVAMAAMAMLPALARPLLLHYRGPLTA
ncbi:MAG: glycosyltransferase family 2 protein [Pseudomonadota bacterium]